MDAPAVTLPHNAHLALDHNIHLHSSKSFVTMFRNEWIIFIATKAYQEAPIVLPVGLLLDKPLMQVFDIHRTIVSFNRFTYSWMCDIPESRGRDYDKPDMRTYWRYGLYDSPTDKTRNLVESGRAVPGVKCYDAQGRRVKLSTLTEPPSPITLEEARETFSVPVYPPVVGGSWREADIANGNDPEELTGFQLFDPTLWI
jgi:hypothetical protein